MTTRPTDEDITNIIHWLDAKYKRHGEDEDKEGADLLRAWLAERQAARGGVTDEMVEKFVELVCKHSNEEIDYVDVMTPRIRAALQSIAQPVRVLDREYLGQQVRGVWIAWAKEQPAPKASWLIPWEGLSERDKEVDRRIGEHIAVLSTSPQLQGE